MFDAVSRKCAKILSLPVEYYPWNPKLGYNKDVLIANYFIIVEITQKIVSVSIKI